MDTNESLRLRASRLVNKVGVSQKVLAAKMGMTPSTFSKWLNQKEGTSPASVTALDGLNRYLEELVAEAQLDVSQLTAEQREQVEAETAVLETEHEIERKERAPKRRTKHRRPGKPLAKKL